MMTRCVAGAIPLIACVIAVLAAGGCATPAPGTLAATDPAAVAHCRDLMYIARAPRGAPNWYLYDRCMQEAGAKQPAPGAVKR